MIPKLMVILVREAGGDVSCFVTNQLRIFWNDVRVKKQFI